MTLDEIDTLLTDTGKQLAPLEVGDEERYATIKQGEIGTYPGDAAVTSRFEQAGRAEFSRLRDERLALTEQVKRARTQEHVLQNRESLYGRAKQSLSDTFSPSTPTEHTLTQPRVPSPEEAMRPPARIAPVQPRATSAVKPPLHTTLNPDDEEAFQQWYADIAKKTGLHPNADEPAHKYDMRAFWRSGQEPAPDPTDVDPITKQPRLHFSSEFKDDDHPNRFVPEHGQILDTKYGKPIAPAEFNAVATPDQKSTLEHHMRQSGLLAEDPQGQPPLSPTVSTPETAVAPPRSMVDATGRQIPVLKNEPKTAADYLSVERVPQIMQEQAHVGLANAMDSMAATLKHYQSHPEQASPLNAAAMKVRELTGRTAKLDLVQPVADLLSSIGSSIRGSKQPLTPQSVPELVAAGVTRFVTETAPEIATLRMLTGNMALAFGVHGLIKGSMFEDAQGKPVFDGLNMHGAMSALVNLATVGILYGLAPTSRVVRAGAGAAIGGGVTAAQGGDPEQVVADAITFAALSSTNPGNPDFMRAWRAQQGAEAAGRPAPRDVTPKTQIPSPEEAMRPQAPPKKPSGPMAGSPFQAEPTAKPAPTPEQAMQRQQQVQQMVNAIPNELQVRQPGQPFLIPSQGQPMTTPAPPTSEQLIPPELGVPRGTPQESVPPASAPVMEPSSIVPSQEVVTPQEAISAGTDQIPPTPAVLSPEHAIDMAAHEAATSPTNVLPEPTQAMNETVAYNPPTPQPAVEPPMMGGEVLRSVHRAAQEAEKQTRPTVQDLHALAEKHGIPWDNDPEFKALTEKSTGKTHLDDLTLDERAKMVGAITDVAMQKKAVPSPEQAVAQPKNEETRIRQRAQDALTKASTGMHRLGFEPEAAALTRQAALAEPKAPLEREHIVRARAETAVPTPEQAVEKKPTRAAMIPTRAGLMVQPLDEAGNPVGQPHRAGEKPSQPVAKQEVLTPKPLNPKVEPLVRGGPPTVIHVKPAETPEQAVSTASEKQAKRYGVETSGGLIGKDLEAIKGAGVPSGRVTHVQVELDGRIKVRINGSGPHWYLTDYREPTTKTTTVPTPEQAMEKPKQSDAAKALLSGRGSTLPDVNKELSTAVQASETLARYVADRLKEEKTAPGVLAFSMADLTKRADYDFGGTQGEGKYTPKDASDAMELGINLYLMEKGQLGVRPGSSVEQVTNTVKWIRDHILDKIPTQTRRTEEQLEFQQFSTPPDLALVMDWVANVRGEPPHAIEGARPRDVVLEPSAGLGGIALFAKNDGAEVIVNELSPRREALLKPLGFDKVYGENAEQLNNILPASIKPTVVLMNPPFSSTAGRIEGERKTANVLTHLDQAFNRLQPGGRLVALIGKGKMYKDPAVLEDWISDMAKQWAYRARIGLSGEGYKKYGTTYSNQILIFDKIAPDGVRPVVADVDDVLDAIPLLKEVRDARHYGTITPSEPRSAESPSEAVSPTRTPSARSRQSVPAPTGTVGTRTRQVATPESAMAGGREPVAGESADVEPGGRARVPARQPRRSTEPTPPAQPTPQSDVGQASRVRHPERAGSADERGPESGLPAEQVSEALTTEASATRSTEAMTDSVYESYTPQKVKIAGAKKHPGKLVESAALSAVAPPDATYRPHLPKTVIEHGQLSDAQLEAVVYAGEAHSQLLPSGERRGFFLGDGPGVGKGRQLAAMIRDNWEQGRKKSVWISETQNLVNAALRDWQALDGTATDLFGLNKFSREQAIVRPTGILYTTYTTMASGLEVVSGGALKAKQAKGQPTGTNVKTRLDQVLAWLGEDFDGLIIFDEAHNMQNSLEREGERGDINPAAKALASVNLQKQLPKARIVYASATAATRVDAMGYAERIGLWGEGTPFTNKTDFVQSIEASGLGAMEIVAQNMKSMGGYMSRNLDYSDVRYRKLEHPLTPVQKDIYNELGKAWQLVLGRLDEALELSGVTGVSRQGTKKTLNARAKSAAYAKFWGSNQRFFNQILTSMQMPSVVEDMRKQLDTGHSLLVQLVNTNEAIMDRQLKEAEQSGSDLESLDMTPKENLKQYVKNSFPVTQFEQYQDDDGNILSRMVLDAKGNPVVNQEAVAMREALLEKIDLLRVPEGPLEILINTFGPKVVAEVTGRSERVVRLKNEDEGTETMQRQARTPAAVREDVEAYMAGKKRILVFSDKGGTGESYHADLTKKNQQPRVHYLLQPGWRADKAVQGLGRSHRTNQASAPEYVLTMTDIKGHKRFISTIARRLDQLGALTKGQRQAGSSGLIDAKDNLENKYASGAIRSFFHDLFHGQVSELSFADVSKKLGLNNLLDKDGSMIEERIPGVPQFLNRLLAMELHDQNHLFDEFVKRMDRAVELASVEGSLDVGMETYRADGGIRILSEEVLHEDPLSKAISQLTHLEAKHSVSFVPATSVEKFQGFTRYLQSHKTEKVWAMLDKTTRTEESGEVVTMVKLQSPVSGKYQFVKEDAIGRNYTALDKPAGRAAWEKQIATEPTHSSERFSMATGNILRIWDRFPKDTAKIRRVQTVDGRRLLGRMLSEAATENLKVKLGKGEKSVPTLDAGQAFDAVLDEGSTLKLTNDWAVKRVKVNNESRIEVTGADLYRAADQLKGYGAFTERIQSSTRFFVPTEKSLGERVLERILRYRPIVALVRKGSELLKEERGSITFGKAPQYTKEAQAYKAQRVAEETGFSSADPDIEARVRAAKQGVQPGSVIDRLTAHLKNVWKLVTREFEHLPDTAEFSPLRTSLLQLQKYKGIAADKIQRELASIIKGLDRKQYDQLEWKALLSDLAREAEADRVLPFGYTNEKVQYDLDRLNQMLDPKVARAWDKRQALWSTLKKDYQHAMDAIGFDTSKKLTKEDYFRHQVLAYAAERALKGTGSRVRTPTGRGFLKQRGGSAMDINANYVQAEFEVMAQMVYDTQLAKVIHVVDQQHNIRKELERQAKDRNKASVQALINRQDEAAGLIDATMKEFSKRIAMHLSFLRKALDLGKHEQVSMARIAEIANDLTSDARPSALGFFKATNERKAFVEQLLGPKYVTWMTLIPDTHTLWQPREGNIFYMADSIPAQLAKALQESMMDEAWFPVEKLRKVLAMGSPREQYVIPTEAAETLDNLSKPTPNWFVQMNKQVLGHWKQLMLIAPRKVIRYNLRNLSGDADATFVGNPGAFKQLPQAARDLIPVIFKDTPLTGEAKEWSQRGGYGSTLQMQELGDLNDLKAFKASLDRAEGGWLKAPAKLWNHYWRTARLSTDYRESLLRYAAYLDYLKQMQANNGRPRNFGASIKATVMALPDLRDRAFKLSNELLGAYDRVSVAGQNLRNFWIPFWSWNAVNASRYYQLMRNAFEGGEGGPFLRGAAVGAKGAASFLLKAAMLWSALQAWNYLMYGDDEQELQDTNPSVANRPHILFGRSDDGKIRYLAGIGALGDLLSWLGLDAFPGLTGDLMHDRITIGEAIKTVVKAPVNKIWQGLTPAVKLPLETAVRESTYPDVFQPRPIQDRGEYLGQQLTLGPEISKLKGKPGKPLYGGEDLTGLVVQRTDHKAAAYSTWQGIEKKYLERMGKDNPSIFWRSPKGEALMNWSRALKEHDAEAETTWQAEYERLEREKYGVKFSLQKMTHDLEQSLRAKAPLAGMSKAERDSVVTQLDAKERRTLDRAEQYYDETLLLVLPPAKRQSFESRLRSRGWLTRQLVPAPHEVTQNE